MRILCALTVLGFILIAPAVHSQRKGPIRHPRHLTIINDPKVRAFVTIEGRRIVQATKNKDIARDYRFYLAEQQKHGWQGSARGGHIIYVNIEAAKNAYLNRGRRMLLLRHILAHEIAHTVLNHSKYSSSSAKELAADRLGITLWKRLGWDCSFWVRGFASMQREGMTSANHPTSLRLRQARNLCPEAEERIKREAKEGQIQVEQRHRAIQIKRAEELRRAEEHRRAEDYKRTEELKAAEKRKREAMKEELRELKLLEQQLKLR